MEWRRPAANRFESVELGRNCALIPPTNMRTNPIVRGRSRGRGQWSTDEVLKIDVKRRRMIIQTKTIKIMKTVGMTMMVMMPAMIYTVARMVPGYVVVFMKTVFDAQEMAK